MNQTPTPSTGLTAAALQDHLSRQLSLSLSDPLNPPKKPRPHACRNCKCRRENRSPVPRTHLQQTSHGRPRGSQTIQGGGKKRQTPLQTANPPYSSPSRTQPHPSLPVAMETERVLDPQPPPLSLAQRLGLVARPEPLLSDEQWRNVKLVSKQRQDSKQPCPVCQEEFGLKEQVLLSCSHVFHKVCLRSVEKYSGQKRCPLCRHSNYQTRVIYEGANCHRIRAATVIQSWWRGCHTRSWYREYRERVPPLDPSLRHKYYQRKLSTLTNRLVESCEQTGSSAINVLAQADNALATARNAMRVFDLHSSLPDPDWHTLRSKLQDTPSTAECPICLTSLQPVQQPTTPQLLNSDPIPMSQPLFRQPQSPPPATPVTSPLQHRDSPSTSPSPSHQLPNSASLLSFTQCHTSQTAEVLVYHPPPLASPALSTSPSACPPSNLLPSRPLPPPHHRSWPSPHPRSIALLSCGHALHLACIQALEQYCSDDEVPLCPLCRAPYHRQLL